MRLKGEQEIRLYGGTRIPCNLQATREQEREKYHADYTEAGICKNRVIMRFLPIFNVWFKKKMFAGFKSLPRAATVQN